MAPPPIHVHDHNSRFLHNEKHDGWGIRSMMKRRPMTMAHGSSNLHFISLCGLWYSTSALSSNTGKAILNQFRYPITLTFVQFGFVAFYCLLSMSPAIRFTRMRMPTRAILRSTFPMGLFQVGGHIFSSIAISRIPVSTVHTIKVSDSLPFEHSTKILILFIRLYLLYSLLRPTLSSSE